MLRSLAIILAAAVIAPAPAVAQDSDKPFLLGNWFVRNCDTPTWKLACMGYTLGLFHGTAVPRDAERTVCLPKGVDNGQMHEVAMSYMRRHPERGHIVGIALIMESWERAFPCDP